jgi:transposase
MQLARVEADIAALDQQIKTRLASYATQHELLMTIPGRLGGGGHRHRRNRRRHVGLSSHRHLAALGGTCPGNNQSAGEHQPCGHAKATAI